MSDKPREWPNIAREARDRAAEEAARGIRALRPVLEEERTFTESDRLKRERIALTALQMIMGLMKDVGAPIRFLDL